MLFPKRTSLFHVCVVLVVWGVLSGGDESEGNISPMEETEKEALYSAIQGFVGNWWNGSDLYPDPCGWTPIQGVSCDLFQGLWYVTVLNIGLVHENSLVCNPNAEFRRRLFELKRLKTLSFVNCFIYPDQHHPISIPDNNWDQLSESLESLEFRSNSGLVGQIPSSIGDLTNLESLVLLENGLSGEIPVDIGKLVSLRRIVVAGNNFSGQIPLSLGGLAKLLIFDSSRNSLTGTLPKTFGGLTSLLKLDMSNNHLGGMLPNELGNLKNLTLLDLRNNRFSGGLVKTIEGMVSLEQMALSNNPIGGHLMGVKWENLQNMLSLDLSYMGLTGEIPESMAEIKRLRYLGLNNNNLSGNVSPKLGVLPCITALYLHNNNMTGKLDFSEWFYGKMGRRFGAWNNHNLCYPMELMPTGHVPFGLKPCDQQQQVSLLEANSKTMLITDRSNSSSHYDFFISVGFSLYGSNGSWWANLGITLLLLNFIL